MGRDEVTLFLAGDVMTGRGIDQILRHPGDPVIFEPYLGDANEYVKLAEQATGPVPRSVDDAYVWGEALTELARVRPDLRLVNLETAVTRLGEPFPKGINYRMHPENVGCLRAAGIQGCSLANNHVLDWGEEGLRETLGTLHVAGIKTAGAGENLAAAWAPAVFDLAGRGRVLFFSFGFPESGIPADWAATDARPGLALLPDLSEGSLARVEDVVRRHKHAADFVVASLHWGDNWGHDVSEAERRFAHGLIDRAGVDLVHGHSSHHPRGLEIHESKVILYGCGDLLNDYEGIGGHEEFRAELGFLYFVTVRMSDRSLARLELVPTRIRNFRVERASKLDAHWMKEVLRRESRKLGTEVNLIEDHRITARAA